MTSPTSATSSSFIDRIHNALESQRGSACRILSKLPMEALAFAVAAVALTVLGFSAASACAGITVGFVVATGLSHSTRPTLQKGWTEFKMKCFGLQEKHPQAEIIALTSTIVISCLSRFLGSVSGIALGCFITAILEIEANKRGCNGSSRPS